MKIDGLRFKERNGLNRLMISYMNYPIELISEILKIERDELNDGLFFDNMIYIFRCFSEDHIYEEAYKFTDNKKSCLDFAYRKLKNKHISIIDFNNYHTLYVPYSIVVSNDNLIYLENVKNDLNSIGLHYSYANLWSLMIYMIIVVGRLKTNCLLARQKNKFSNF
jgi:hypothetical protein